MVATFEAIDRRCKRPRGAIFPDLSTDPSEGRQDTPSEGHHLAKRLYSEQSSSDEITNRSAVQGPTLSSLKDTSQAHNFGPAVIAGNAKAQMGDTTSALWHQPPFPAG